MDVKKIIDALGTDKEASAVLGLSISAVNRLRRGVSQPSFETVQLLEAAARQKPRRKRDAA